VCKQNAVGWTRLGQGVCFYYIPAKNLTSHASTCDQKQTRITGVLAREKLASLDEAAVDDGWSICAAELVGLRSANFTIESPGVEVG